MLELARRLIGHNAALGQQSLQQDVVGAGTYQQGRQCTRSPAIEVVSQLGPNGRLEALRSAAQRLALEARFETAEMASGGEGGGGFGGGEMTAGPQAQEAVMHWRRQVAALCGAVGPLLSSLGLVAADGYEPGSSAAESVFALLPAAHACLATILQVRPV